jgi:hypothetical protein
MTHDFPHAPTSMISALFIRDWCSICNSDVTNWEKWKKIVWEKYYSKLKLYKQINRKPKMKTQDIIRIAEINGQQVEFDMCLSDTEYTRQLTPRNMDFLGTGTVFSLDGEPINSPSFVYRFYNRGAK